MFLFASASNRRPLSLLLSASWQLNTGPTLQARQGSILRHGLAVLVCRSYKSSAANPRASACIVQSYRRADIELTEELGNPKTDADSHVWKVKINGEEKKYALKMVNMLFQAVTSSLLLKP